MVLLLGKYGQERMLFTPAKYMEKNDYYSPTQAVLINRIHNTISGIHYPCCNHAKSEVDNLGEYSDRFYRAPPPKKTHHLKP